MAVPLSDLVVINWIYLHLESFYETLIYNQKCNWDSASLRSVTFNPCGPYFPQVLSFLRLQALHTGRNGALLFQKHTYKKWHSTTVVIIFLFLFFVSLGSSFVTQGAFYAVWPCRQKPWHAHTKRILEDKGVAWIPFLILWVLISGLC